MLKNPSDLPPLSHSTANPNFRPSYVPSVRSQSLPKGFSISDLFSLFPTHFPCGGQSSSENAAAGPSPDDWLLTPPNHIIPEPKLHSWAPDSSLTDSLNSADSHLKRYPASRLCLGTLGAVHALWGLPRKSAFLPTLLLYLTKFYSFLKLRLKCISWIQSCPIFSPPPDTSTARLVLLQQNLSYTETASVGGEWKVSDLRT